MMKILVLLKETIATEAKIRLTQAGEIDCGEVEKIINPYDEYALEEAISLKERLGGEVVIYTVGQVGVIPNLKIALARGADRAVLIASARKDSIGVSGLLAEAIEKYDEDFDLLFAGWVAVDDNNAQIPARLSRILNLPLVNVVTGFFPEPEGEIAICHRENEEWLETVEITLPAVIAVQKGLNTPRYPTVLNILEAKYKEIKIYEPDTLPSNEQISLKYRLPLKKRSGCIIKELDPEAAAGELIAKLLAAKAL